MGLAICVNDYLREPIIIAIATDLLDRALYTNIYIVRRNSSNALWKIRLQRDVYHRARIVNLYLNVL